MLILERKSMLSREVTNEVCDEHTECEADGSQLTARQTKVQQSSHFLETRIVSMKKADHREAAVSANDPARWCSLQSKWGS